jgi:hypothetical protein
LQIGYSPSKTQLLYLDFLIIFLQILLVTIAYETAFLLSSPVDTLDTLLDHETTSPNAPLPLALDDHNKPDSADVEPLYIIDLRMALILARLRTSPPTAGDSTRPLLPLPNSTPWPLPGGIRVLFRARTAVRRRTQSIPENEGDGPSGRSNSRVPGGIDVDDDG